MVIYSGFSHEKWWFSIAMLVHQRVIEILSLKAGTNGDSDLCVCLKMQVVSHHVAPSENGGKARGWTSGTVAYLTNPSEIIWLCQNSYWSHGPVEIVDLPSWKMVVIFHSYVNVYHRVSFGNPERVVYPTPLKKNWSVGMMKFHSQLFLESHSKFHGSKPPTRSYLLGIPGTL